MIETQYISIHTVHDILLMMYGIEIKKKYIGNVLCKLDDQKFLHCIGTHAAGYNQYEITKETKENEKILR